MAKLLMSGFIIQLTKIKMKQARFHSIIPSFLMSGFNRNNDSNSSNEKYIPEPAIWGERKSRRRKASGWTGLVLTVIAITLLLGLTPHWMRLAVFIPAVMGATGFIQAYNKFCVYFGFGHMFNLGEVGKTDTIDQKEFRAKDRARAWQLLAYAFGIGLIITVIVYLLP
ncbi:MAG: hypothetical protein IPK96_21940 [Flammeovirgaceae bacterium]|nr:hypothetical protein [Flammeovirgaceae bacterium]